MHHVQHYSELDLYYYELHESFISCDQELESVIIAAIISKVKTYGGDQS